MKLPTYSDLTLLRGSLLAISASALFSGIFLYGSAGYATRMSQDLRNAQQHLNAVRNQLVSAHEDRKNMATYADEYAALDAGHVIGDDQRLDWIEGLEELRRQQLVSAFRYNIAPQKPYPYALPIASGNFDIHYSSMSLEFDLLHEGQLLRFFSELRSQSRGHYQLRGCTLQRLDDGRDDGLKAACDGGWITLKNRNSTP